MGLYSREQLVDLASLTAEDIRKIKECRRTHNRLGFAYQIGFVRLLNRFPSQQPFEIINELLIFTGVQIRTDPEHIAEYAARRETVAEHQARIREYLKLRSFGGEERQHLERFLLAECFRIEQTAALLGKARQFLRANSILQPAISTLERVIGEQRNASRTRTFEQFFQLLTPEHKAALDSLLDSENGKSELNALKQAPLSASPGAILKLTAKLEFVRKSKVLDIDVTWLNNNFRRSLTKYARKSSSHKIGRLEEKRRYATLTIFLIETYKDTIDQLVVTLDKLVSKICSRAQNQFDEALRGRHQAMRNSIATMRKMADVILNAAVTDADVRNAIFEWVPREELLQQFNESEELLSGRNSHVFCRITDRYEYIRRFFPVLLVYLDCLVTDSEQPAVMDAVGILKTLNEEGKRSLPDEVPLNFLSRRMRSLVESNGEVSRRAWECALLVSLNDAIKTGNVSIQNSRRFGLLSDFFIDDETWSGRRAGFFQVAGLPADAESVPGYLGSRLNRAFDDFLASQPDNSFAAVDENGWRLSVDPAEKPADKEAQNLQRLKNWLAKHMRQIRLPELLIEVDNELHLTKPFLPQGRQKIRDVEDVCSTLVAILAHGCNIGPFTMAKLTEGVSYSQIKRISDWHLTEDNQRAALAQVVNAMSQLGAAKVWGTGKSSSSDGRRYIYPRQVLQRTFSHKMHDFALEFYSFVADNYAPFYSTPIECTERDAGYVLDGLLYNESDLSLDEHYTDTHGYTEINFAAFAMLGKRFCPRIKGIKHQRIYRIDKDRNYGALDALVNRNDRTINLKVIRQQWEKMAQFYSSLESGHVTASVALKRLAGYSKRNLFYKANRELGRVFKTEFVLQYMSQPPLRRRIRRGLLKGEQLHALAKDVFYAKRGRINSRDLHEQMNSCSCLTLILASIIYWQAKEIGRVVSEMNAEKDGIDLALLEHVSPIEWENILLYGEYVIDKNLIRVA